MACLKLDKANSPIHLERIWTIRCCEVQVCVNFVYHRDIFDGQKVQAVAKALFQF